MITSARLFTTRTLTPTPPFIISPQIPAIAKKVSLAVNSRDFAVFVLKTQDFLEKGGEMVSFFEQRGYSPALLQNDLQAIWRLDRTDVLKNHNPSNQRLERIPLVLTYHPLNERVKRILLPRNQTSLSAATTGRLRRGSNFRDILVHTSDSSQPSFQAGTSPCLHARCRTCHHIFSDTNVRGPQYSFVIKNAFSCQTSGLVYCISCRRCPAVYIGETGRTLRQRLGEHLRSIEKNLPGFPVAEHFNTAGHLIDDALVPGIMLWRFFNLAPVSRAV